MNDDILVSLYSSSVFILLSINDNGVIYYYILPVISKFISLSRTQTIIAPSLNPQATILPLLVISEQFSLLLVLSIVKQPIVGGLLLLIFIIGISKGTKSLICSGKGNIILDRILFSPRNLPLFLFNTSFSFWNLL